VARPIGTRGGALALAFAAACVAGGLNAASAQSGPSGAKASPSATPPVAPTPDGPPRERTVSTEHTAVINGKTVAYVATAGTIFLRDDKDEATASVFYHAYVATGLGPTSRRPITFSYNGGPGGSSALVDMGAFGPRTVVTINGEQSKPPPYDIVDNQNSILDKTDLVFIDAPGTGFSRLIGKGTPKDYYGVDEDGRAFAQFIRRYITTNDRWNSPKYLIGESYGTTRSAVLADLLERGGIAVTGVTLMSTVLDFSTLEGGPGDDAPYISFLPTEAAVAAYQKKIAAPADLDAFLAEVRAFAAGPYASALLAGDPLPASDRTRIANKLHDYTGLPVDYILRSDLRIPPQRFQKALLDGDEETVGRYDARFRGFDIDPIGADAQSDPSSDAVFSAFTASFNRYVRSELGYKTDDEYRFLSGEVNRTWDWGSNGRSRPVAREVIGNLSRAMTADRYLHVLSVNGLYDMATPFFATERSLNDLSIVPQLQKNISFKYYPSGHMIYINPVAHDALRADLDAFYSATSAQ
jgi:carboxypeptidase C (cathepsin A)